MHKAIGICILLFAIFRISRTVCEKERNRIFLLSEMSKFMHEVRHSLTVSMKPLSDICKEFKTDEPYFSSLLDTGFKSLSEPGVLRELEARAGGGASSVFVSFIGGFGRGYLSEEAARCDLAIKEFDSIYNGERAAVAKKLRVCKTLGVASSFALVILFI